MKRGEVYWLRYDNSWGHEQSVGRPVVILSGDENRWDTDDPGTVVVAYMTTSPKPTGMNVPVVTNNRKGWVMCNQLGTVDGRRLTDLADTLSDMEYDAVKEALIQTLHLDIPQKEESEMGVELSQLKEEILNLKLELEIQKKMYDRVLGLLVEERVGRDIAVKAPEVVVAPEPPKPEPIEIDTELLKIQMSTPNKLLDDPQENKVKTKLKPKKLSNAKVSEKKANVNTDDWKTIGEITGLCESTARSIVQYRNKHGKYVSLEDLLMVPRFGKVCMNKYGSMLEV